MRNDGFSRASQASTTLEALRPIITRENALQLLHDVACLYCDAVGEFSLFVNPNNYGTGIRCDACGKRHPFMRALPMWLRGATSRQQPSVPIDPVIVANMTVQEREQWLQTGSYVQVVAWADGDEMRLREIARLRGYASG
jgi:hypothetical protein